MHFKFSKQRMFNCNLQGAGMVHDVRGGEGSAQLVLTKSQNRTFKMSLQSRQFKKS